MSKTVSFDEAAQLVDLRSLLPAYDEDEDVVVLEPGKLDASALDLDERSYIVDGALELEGDLAATEEGGFLVVAGNLRARNVLIGGPIVHVGGSLTVGHAIHADYNHGVLVVRGGVSAATRATTAVRSIRGVPRLVLSRRDAKAKAPTPARTIDSTDPHPSSTKGPATPIAINPSPATRSNIGENKPPVSRSRPVHSRHAARNNTAATSKQRKDNTASTPSGSSVNSRNEPTAPSTSATAPPSPLASAAMTRPTLPIGRS